MSLHAPQWLLLLAPLLLAWGLLFRRARKTRWLRLLIAVLAVLALSDPRLRGRSERAIALLIDRSASVAPRALEQARALAPELEAAALRQDGGFWVLGFGRGASVLSGPGERFEPRPGATGEDDSDLALGLRLALASLPEHTPAELVVISDGVYTAADPRLEIPNLLARDIRVHVVDVNDPAAADSAITRVLAPPRVARGQRFGVAVELSATRAQAARLLLRDRAGHVLSEHALQLSPGVRRYSLPLRAEHSGVQEFEAVLEVDGDTRPGNNRARGVVEVVGPARVLLYNGQANQSALARALTASGLELELCDARTPLTQSALIGVAALVLENMQLDNLGPQADEIIANYVRHMGGGLLVTGGRSSYAMGGYFRSALEDLLPVSLEREQELRRPRIDMVIALDRSGSMSAPARNGGVKMDLANRGAAESIGLLSPGDGVALLAIDSEVHVVNPLERIREPGDRHRLGARALGIEVGGGGIFIGVALAAAVETLLPSTAPTRHIVLFADASDSEEPGDYAKLIASWRAAHGTLSVIGLGTPLDSDAALLRDIAQLGGGRVFFTEDAMDLPRVFAQEVMYLARNTFVDARTPVLGARGLLALGAFGQKIPDVDGYNLTFAREGAEPFLLSGDEHDAPLAAGWQRGTGKVVAVTFEADGMHTGALAAWPQYGAFFRSLLEWLKRPPAPEDLDASIRLDGRMATISVQLPQDYRGAVPTQALLLSSGDPTLRPVRLQFSGPNALSASVPIDSGGVHQAIIPVAGKPALSLPPVALPYSPEFAQQVGDDSGAEVLAQLARGTGGQAYTRVEGLLRPHTASVGDRSLTPWFAGVMLMLIILEVAKRRGLLDARLARLSARGQRVRQRVWQQLARWSGTVRPRSLGARPAAAATPAALGGPAVGGVAQEPPGSPPAGAEPDPLVVAKRRARRADPRL